MAHIPPSFKSDGFHCPHCGTYAHQTWGRVYWELGDRMRPTEDLYLAMCYKCQQTTVWRDENIIDPTTHSAPDPNPDLPDDAKTDYLEARDILDKSTRGAAALLRLSIEKLCNSLGAEGPDLNTKIHKLVEGGLDVTIQNALDIVRVVGNNAVHSGELDLKDDRKTATALFDLVNLIAESMITRPKKINDLYGSLPEGPRDAIEKRDRNVNGG